MKSRKHLFLIFVVLTAFVLFPAIAAENEYKSLESMGETVLDELISFYVPSDFQILDEEAKSQKYLTLSDQVVLTNGKVDIVLQLDENKLKNEVSEVGKARNGIANNLSAALPGINVDTSMMLKIGNKYMALIRFNAAFEDFNRYTIITVFEVNSQTLVMTYSIEEDLIESQETFWTILTKIKFK